MKVYQWRNEVANSKSGIFKCDMIILKTTTYHKGKASGQKTR